jgi:hypothetical protein
MIGILLRNVIRRASIKEHVLLKDCNLRLACAQEPTPDKWGIAATNGRASRELLLRPSLQQWHARRKYAFLIDVG